MLRVMPSARISGILPFKEWAPKNACCLLSLASGKGIRSIIFLRVLPIPNPDSLGVIRLKACLKTGGLWRLADFQRLGICPTQRIRAFSLLKAGSKTPSTTRSTLARKMVPNPDAILIHFDADLYSSTLFLLCQLYREFDRYYFIFDEFTGE